MAPLKPPPSLKGILRMENVLVNTSYTTEVGLGDDGGVTTIAEEGLSGRTQ